MIARFVGFALALVLIALPVAAEEAINDYRVDINVETDGDIIVTETLNVMVEGYAIKRGIFRDLPRYYADEATGGKLPYVYKVLSVRRDGRKEPYSTNSVDNAWRIMIGDEDIYLTHEPHIYEIRYRVKNQVRYFDDHDEVYWNVTGNDWQFAIDAAQARITLPEGARITSQDGYTGPQGEAGRDYAYMRDGDTHIFTTTRKLWAGEGLTVALGIEKGVIDPPSAADARMIWWQRYGAIGVLGVTLLGVFAFLYRSWKKVGVDPPKGPVFARYAPPENYSPAAVHHIYNRGFKGHGALIATLVNLGIHRHIKIDASEKKSTILTSEIDNPERSEVRPVEQLLEDQLFDSTGQITMGEKYNAGFTSAYQAFRKAVSEDFGQSYFKRNLGYTIAAIVLTGGALIFALVQTSTWTVWHTALIIGLAVINGLFMYLMPAPTRIGQSVRTEIEGFKLYLETAEKLQLNSVEVGSDAPPPMTTERYEAFLPYAIALDVEEPWSKHFEKLLPHEAEAYSPAWGYYGAGRMNSLADMNKSMVSSISSGVTSSMPQSSSSSGSGGGGFSGGGGGGGGGGGW